MRKVIKRLISIVAVLTLSIATFAGCATKTAKVESSKKDELIRVPKDKPGMLFKVKGTEIYLYGTQHIINKSSLPLNETVENAVKSSDIFASEVGEEAYGGYGDYSEYFTYKDGDNIYNHVSKEGKKVIDNLTEEMGSLKDYLTLNFFNFNQMAIILYLSQEKVETGYSLDQYLTILAKQNSKEIVGLEDMLGHYKLISNISDEDQEKMSFSGVENIRDIINSLDIGSKKLGEGDEEFFISYRNEMKNALSEEGYNALLANRDKNMTEKIEVYIKNRDKIFVAVGAGHLAGDDSIVGLLRSKGYEVEKVTN